MIAVIWETWHSLSTLTYSKFLILLQHKNMVLFPSDIKLHFKPYNRERGKGKGRRGRYEPYIPFLAERVANLQITGTRKGLFTFKESMY